MTRNPPSIPAAVRFSECNCSSASGRKWSRGDAEHQARHKTDGHLQARVGRTNDQQQPAAHQRRQHHQHAVNREQPDGRNHGLLIAFLTAEDQPENSPASIVSRSASCPNSPRPRNPNRCGLRTIRAPVGVRCFTCRSSACISCRCRKGKGRCAPPSDRCGRVWPFRRRRRRRLR